VQVRAIQSRSRQIGVRQVDFLQLRVTQIAARKIPPTEIALACAVEREQSLRR
jgi:hypothetical protein